MMAREARLKKTFGFQESWQVCVDEWLPKPHAHAHFNMFVDQYSDVKICESRSTEYRNISVSP